MKLAIAVAAIGISAALYWFVFRNNESTVQQASIAKEIPAQNVLPQPQNTSLGSASSAATAPQISNAPTVIRPGQNNVMELPPENVPLTKILASLKSAVTDGSIPAACRLAFELSRCSGASDIEKAASNTEDEVAKLSPNHPAYARRVAQSKALRDEANTAARVCSGVPVAETSEAWRYAYAAAESGHLPSMVRYVVQNGNGLNRGDPAATAEGWYTYSQAAPGMLQRAIEQGSAEAFEYAAFMHLRTNSAFRLVPFDRVKGIAYYMALKQYASPAYTSVLDRNIQFRTEDLRITADELAHASALAQTLAGKLSKTAVGSVDFTKGTSPINDGSHCRN